METIKPLKEEEISSKKITLNNVPILNEKEITLKENFSDNIEIKSINYLTKITYIDKNNVNNIFCVFESINNNFFLIFAHYSSIIIYNIIDNKKVNEIIKAHNALIDNFQYHYDYINNRDLIMSISLYDCNIKIWDINKLECLFNNNYQKDNGIITACLFIHNEQNYFAIGYYNKTEIKQYITIYDLKENENKQLKNSNDNIYYIDVYYDKKNKINYIIAGSDNFVKSFDYEQNKLYHIYSDNTSQIRNCVIIHDNEKIIELLESNQQYLRIWNFHTGELLKKIIFIGKINCFCLWKNNYLFANEYFDSNQNIEDKDLILIDLNKNIIIKSLPRHNQIIKSIKTLSISKYGEVLVTQGQMNDRIKFWIIKEKQK